MGDPKKFRKKYQTPMHPWNKAAIDEEAEIKSDYGIRRKKEIYLMQSFLKRYRNIAKRLSTETTDQSVKEAKDVLEKLQRLGLLAESAELNQILALTLKDILERRLQSVIYRKGMARSMKQARQFVTHRHILVSGKEITAPSYLLTLTEEANLSFKDKSSLASETHPERVDPQLAIKEEAERLRKETEELKKAEAAKKVVDKATPEEVAEPKAEAAPEIPKVPKDKVEEKAEVEE